MNEQAEHINALSVMLYKKVLGTVQTREDVPEWLKGYTSAYEEVVDEIRGTIEGEEEDGSTEEEG